MTRPTLLLLHGWGFDASLWDALRAELPEFAAATRDRGYFGAPAQPVVEGPVLAVGHSLGALLLAQEALANAIGLVAINGFDRFTGDGAAPPRVLERMRKRFAEAPAEVLDDFRARCGAGAAPAGIDPAPLAADLAVLAEADARKVRRPPTLVLHGAADPILPPPMRATVFAPSIRATFPEAGHLLPLTHAEWCADRIRGFVDTLE